MLPNIGKAYQGEPSMHSGNTILGLSAYYHDSAAALIRDGEIIAAAQEERFTRKEARCQLFRNTPSATAWQKPV